MSKFLTSLFILAYTSVFSQQVTFLGQLMPSTNTADQKEVQISVNKKDNTNVIAFAQTCMGGILSVTSNGFSTKTVTEIIEEECYSPLYPTYKANGFANIHQADPATGFDANGHAYIVSMSQYFTHGNNQPGYILQKSTNKGVSWTKNNGSTGYDLSYFNHYVDKEMIALDDVPTSPYANNFYCAYMGNMGMSGRTVFNKFNSATNSFSTPIILRNEYTRYDYSNRSLR